MLRSSCMGKGNIQSMPMISVILPIGNELSALTRSLKSFGADRDKVEIVIASASEAVADAVARQNGVVFVSATGYRAALCNAGAAAATGDVLLFLHPGVTIERNWREAVEKAVAKESFGVGSFRLRTGPQGLKGLTNRIFAAPTVSTHALFMKSATFSAIGGFPDEASEGAAFIAKAMDQDVGVQTLDLSITLPEAVGSSGPETEQVAVILMGSGSSNPLAEVASSLFGEQDVPRISSSLIHKQLRIIRGLCGPVSVYASGLPEAHLANLDDSPLLAAQQACQLGSKKVLLIDALQPGLTRCHLQSALKALDEVDLVVGPTDIGSCFLLGLDCARADDLAGSSLELPVTQEAIEQLASAQELNTRSISELVRVRSKSDLLHYYGMGELEV